MSFTEIYAVTKKGNPIFIGEAKNSNLGAMWIWVNLFNKYIKNNDKKYFNNHFNEIWNLIQNKNLFIYEKIVLVSTFDQFILLKEELDLFLKCLNRFNKSSLINSEDILNPNLVEQEIILLNHKKYNKYIGFIWNQTCVNGDKKQAYNIEGDKNYYSIQNYLGQSLEELISEFENKNNFN